MLFLLDDSVPVVMDAALSLLKKIVSSVATRLQRKKTPNIAEVGGDQRRTSSNNEALGSSKKIEIPSHGDSVVRQSPVTCQGEKDLPPCAAAGDRCVHCVDIVDARGLPFL